jgi:hypothetical protein
MIFICIDLRIPFFEGNLELCGSAETVFAS